MVRKFKVGPIFFGLSMSIFTAFNAYAGGCSKKRRMRKTV